MGLHKKQYQVKDLVIDDEYGTIDSDATIEDAAKEMKKIGIPDLVVLEKGSGKVLGMIADFDIVQNVVAEGENPKTTNVKSKMYVITPVGLETPVEQVYKQLQELGVSVVPVVDKEMLVGVATIQDCWGYIPDQIPDEIGLIPVENTKIVEFWFSSVCAIMALVFGIILPIAEVYGFFSLNQVDFLNYIGAVGLSGGDYTFFPFEVKGIDFNLDYFHFNQSVSATWIGISIFNIFVLIFALIGLFSLIYTAFMDTKKPKTGKILRYIIPLIPIILMIIQWISYSIALTTAASYITGPQIDVVGLILSIFSMVLFLLAIFRDYIFVQKGISNNTKGGA
ncbi:MAG: CBS domain-containing protein [Candidatus Lokiarchaeota archaeon]|nr:CBS domain-containing protein [Candidatus Lokiarchaeota archaeon]